MMPVIKSSTAAISLRKSSPYFIFNNNWSNIIAVKDNVTKTLKVYINGVLANSATYTTTGTIGKAQSLLIGNSLENKPFHDIMDDVRLYNYSLTPAEIQAINSGTPLVSKATNPVPANGATNINYGNVATSWDGSAQTYNLYFGDAPGSLSLLATGLTERSYNLTGLNELKTYYWRVDAVRDGEVVTGDVWSFTTVDKVKPTVKTKDVTLSLDNSGNATLTAEQVNDNSSDDFGIAHMEISKSTFNCSNVGENTVILTVTDNNGNTETAEATITVVDNTAPVVVTKNITATLINGEVQITAADVNDGSSDACGVETLSLDKTLFTCANVGSNTVILSVTDNNGNTATGEATVTVVDNTAPVVVTKNITATLINGEVQITAADVNDGSSDACGVETLSLDKTLFTCANVGSNTVILSVTDNNGNTATGEATVTVVDNTAPVVVTKNITVTLINGQVQITAADVNNGSSDACGVETLSLDKTLFTCANLGSNTVILTVTDKNGNSNSATAIVTVNGAIPAPAITVSRTDNTNTGGDANTIYLGYGAQQVTLTASNPAGPATWSWSPVRWFE